jgi:hypothetical protein
MMQRLFAAEHNAICDMLHARYPLWTDEELFQRARLINAALIAKIHTVEWTPAVISHPTTVAALRANWFGIAGERVHKLFGRVSASEVVSGIPGAATDHFGVPFALTEEEVRVSLCWVSVGEQADVYGRVRLEPHKPARAGAPIRHAGPPLACVSNRSASPPPNRPPPSPDGDGR